MDKKISKITKDLFSMQKKVQTRICCSEVDQSLIYIRNKLLEHTNLASMGQVVVSSDDKNIIGTTALDTCFGIVFYDRKNKKGIVGHASSSGKILTLRQMLDLLDDTEKLVIEYAIISGFRNEDRKDYSGVEEILNYLTVACPQNVTFIPFQSELDVQMCSNVFAYEFAFDVKTSLPVSKTLFYDSRAIKKRK